MADSALVIDVLKTHLKAKRITYKDLAHKMSLSEPTIKRWFSTGNITLKQLDEICTQLNTSLSEILSFKEDHKSQDYFSDGQEVALGKNEKLLILFYLIAGGVSLKSILKNYTFAIQESESLMLQLDKLDLIEMLPEDRYRLKVSPGILWQPSGLLSKKYFHLIRDDFMNSYFIGKDQNQWFFYGQLSSASYEVIQKKIDRLAKDIKELYRIDLKDKKALNRSLFIGFRPWDFNLITKYKMPRT